MDYRCPVCKANLGTRRLSQAVITRMEIDCSHCKAKIHLNVHRAEEIVVLLGFGAIIAFAVCAYRLQSQALALAAVLAAMAGALALPVLERTWLRTWPRYASGRPDA